MAVAASHAALPFPVYGARYSHVLTMVASTTGVPTDPTTPACAVSKDGAAYGAAAETPTVLGSAKGTVLTTFSGAEMTCDLLVASFSAASGPTLRNEVLRPRRLPALHSGMAQAGAAGTLTLATGAPAFDLTGCILRTTGGTGGGGTGGANNQARVITGYVPATKVATVSPSWETTPDVTTTYDVLLTDVASAALRGAFVVPADYAVQALDIAALLAALGSNVLTAGMLQRAR